MDSNSLIKEMNAYYSRRAPWHDRYMNYTDNQSMEDLLGPIIERIEPYVARKDILEIACGTGNWTRVLAGRARSVLATDVNKSVLNIARDKLHDKKNVTFVTADAYDLTAIKDRFNAAFAADWFSHIPKAKIDSFIAGLHKKLNVASKVVLLDMMPGKHDLNGDIFFDDDGNRISKRFLPDGSSFHVVKNFPTQDEFYSLLGNRADDMEFYEDLPLRRWIFTYSIR